VNPALQLARPGLAAAIAKRNIAQLSPTRHGHSLSIVGLMVQDLCQGEQRLPLQAEISQLDGQGDRLFEVVLGLGYLEQIPSHACPL